MSLMRWLAACSSLKSVEDRPSPYRMNENYLPRFEQKNAKGRIMTEPRPPPGKRIWCWIREWIFEPWQPTARKLKQLLPPWRLRRSKKRPKSIVQAELLLETVRVIRNDLREEDFMKSAGRPAAAGTSAASGRGWGRITARIFRAGQSVR